MSSFLQKRSKRQLYVFTLLGIFFVPFFVLALYVINTPPPPLWEGLSFSYVIEDRRGELMHISLSKDEKYRIYTDIQHIPQHVRDAVLLYEDTYFYQHPGVNVFSLVRAVKNLITGERRVGASTIAMQVARLRYKLVTNTFKGKAIQILIALQLIWHYGHDNVLEAYFSLAPYGGNIEGIEAAARVYFQQSAQTLTHSQALALCLIPQNPNSRSFQNAQTPTDTLASSSATGLATGSAQSNLLPPEYEKARNALHKKWNEAYPEQSVSAKAPPLRLYSKAELPFIAPHMCMELLQQAQNIPNTIATRSLLSNTSIQSTIDSAQQALLEKNITQFIDYCTPYGISNASAMLLHWPSMEVHALVGSAYFFKESIDGQVDGTKARRSPGSTLKPFIYALALDQGLIHPQSMLMDAPRSFAEYNPENFDKQFQGPLPAHEALRLSRNVPAIELASRLNPTLYDFLQRGQANFSQQADYYGLSLVLGGAELSMRDLVRLYAMLANQGIYQEMNYIKFPTEKRPKVFPLLSKEAALLSLYMLESPDYDRNFNAHSFFENTTFPVNTLFNNQTFSENSYHPNYQNHTQQKKSLEIPVIHRYKTGTSNGFRDAWAIGVVGPYVLAVWLGNFDNTSNRMLVGSTVASPLYMSIANDLIRKENLHDILREKSKETKLIQIDTCKDTGDVQTNLCPNATVKTWLIPGKSPIQNSHVYRKIWIDTRSGLRVCPPLQTKERRDSTENALDTHEPAIKEVIWEFWPSEVYQLFAEAGLYKPLPPPFAEQVANTTENQGQGTHANIFDENFCQGIYEHNIYEESAIHNLHIQSPRKGVLYHRESENNVLAFQAVSSADVKTIFWFVDEEYVGSSEPSQPFLWKMKEGKHIVRALDDRGQSKEVLLTIALTK